jgi:hypothetical protein
LFAPLPFFRFNSFESDSRPDIRSPMVWCGVCWQASEVFQLSRTLLVILIVFLTLYRGCATFDFEAGRTLHTCPDSPCCAHSSSFLGRWSAGGPLHRDQRAPAHILVARGSSRDCCLGDVRAGSCRVWRFLRDASSTSKYAVCTVHVDYTQCTKALTLSLDTQDARVFLKARTMTFLTASEVKFIVSRFFWSALLQVLSVDLTSVLTELCLVLCAPQDVLFADALTSSSKLLADMHVRCSCGS